jgi:hypothetical protein
MPPLTGLRRMGDAPPMAAAVGQTMSALTSLAWQEYVTVFTNGSTKLCRSVGVELCCELRLQDTSGATNGSQEWALHRGSFCGRFLVLITKVNAAKEKEGINA